jgi:hypothetical protein
MCSFHLREDHDGDKCVNMIKYKKIMENKEQIVEYLESEDGHTPYGDSELLFLDYESNSKNWRGLFCNSRWTSVNSHD